MKKLISMDDFYLTKVHADYMSADALEGSQGGSPLLDYDIFRKDANGRQFAMRLRCQAVFRDTPAKTVLSISCEITGLFSFAKEATEEEMQALIRINGATILYGIMRGQVAMLTGAFPGQRFLLPAVYMQEVVPEIEKRKANQRSAKTSEATVTGKPEKIKRKTPVAKKPRAARKGI